MRLVWGGRSERREVRRKRGEVGGPAAGCAARRLTEEANRSRANQREGGPGRLGRRPGRTAHSPCFPFPSLRPGSLWRRHAERGGNERLADEGSHTARIACRGTSRGKQICNRPLGGEEGRFLVGVAGRRWASSVMQLVIVSCVGHCAPRGESCQSSPAVRQIPPGMIVIILVGRPACWRMGGAQCRHARAACVDARGCRGRDGASSGRHGAGHGLDRHRIF